MKIFYLLWRKWLSWECIVDPVHIISLFPRFSWGGGGNAIDAKVHVSMVKIDHILIS